MSTVDFILAQAVRDDKPAILLFHTYAGIRETELVWFLASSIDGK